MNEDSPLVAVMGLSGLALMAGSGTYAAFVYLGPIAALGFLGLILYAFALMVTE